MKKHREMLDKLNREGRFTGESYMVNTYATCELLKLMAEACDLLEEIRDEMKARKDEGR